MVMKVTGVNNLFFRGNTPVLPDNTAMQKNQKDVKELGYVTPDFNVKMPVKYTPTGIHKIQNGLELYTYRLSNGYKVSIVPMEGSPAVVKTYVNVGSMNETHNIKGISHFLEHMAFNGTNGNDGHIELKTGDSFKKIDEMGGWANASTNYAITDYVNSTPQLDSKDLETQIKVIAAMAEDMKLSEEMIKKEKGPVSSEINMIMDDPDTIAIDQTVRTLFNIKNPADELVGGSVEHIQNLTQQDVVDYYDKYYTPDNTNIVITGDVNPDEVIELISKNFTSNKVSRGKKFEERLNPITKTVRKDFISDKASGASMVLGFAGPVNTDTRDNILYSVVGEYINLESSGLIRNLNKYNAGYSLDSQKISTNPNSPRMISMFITSSEKNSENALNTVLNTIASLKPIDEETLNQIRERIKSKMESNLEHSDTVNDFIGNSMLDNDMDYATKYNEILDSLTPEEANTALKKFFDINKTAITVVHPPKQTDNIAFKGNRIPIEKSKISKETTQNNYDLAFYDTKSQKVNLQIELDAKEPFVGKPGLSLVLNEIYRKGTLKNSEKDFYDYLDKNNINASVSPCVSGLSISAGGRGDKYKLALEKAKELLYYPNITEETLKAAIETVKDNFEQKQDSSSSLYFNYESQNLPYYFTDEEIKKSLDSITVDDVKSMHKYLLENSTGVAAVNLPSGKEAEVKNYVTDFISGLDTVKPNEYSRYMYYKPTEKTTVLTKANNNSQADIKQTFKFEADDDIKEIVSGKIANLILSSSSIGLFDNLREKENLAYSVYSSLVKEGNIGELSLNILTTTDNKEIGEYSYDNVQKSINGFNRQIGELLNGNFTEQDLENAKRSIKASLLNNEGNYPKLHSLIMGMESKYGIDYKNKIYDEVDKITKEDITKFAKKVFTQKPVYTIVCSQDTLDANKEFLKQLEK